MSNPERPSLHDSSLDDPNQRVQSPAEARPSASGSPLPADAGTPLPPQPGDSLGLSPASPAPERALVRPAQPASHPEQSSGVQRAVAAFRMVMPVVQKVLPLLDGNIASAISNILLPRTQAAPHPGNLAPVESALAKLHVEQRELRGQVTEQNTALRRVADQLEMAKEATDRNTLELRELTEDLASFRRKVKVFAWAGLGLLALSILINVILFLRLQRVLP